jgi:hypothetical protein
VAGLFATEIRSASTDVKNLLLANTGSVWFEKNLHGIRVFPHIAIGRNRYTITAALQSQ